MNFEAIQERVEEFLQNYRSIVYTWDDQQYKLQASDAIFCAEDRVRNRAFFEAIGKCIQDLQEQGVSPIRTVDAGSGTGILGLFALEAGATHCTFLEHNPKSLEINKALIQEFGYTAQSAFVQCDATNIKLVDTYELLISETLTSGFLREDFIQIIKNLLPYSTTQKVIPEAFIVEYVLPNKQKQENQCTSHQVESLEAVFNKSQLYQKIHPSCIVNTHTILYRGVVLPAGSCISFMNPLFVAL